MTHRMPLIGIVPYKTRFEWTRNEDGTFNLTHTEWMDKENYDNFAEQTKILGESLLENFDADFDAEFTLDDDEYSMSVIYNRTSGLHLLNSLISESAIQFLYTEADYLAAIANLVMASPLGGIFTAVSTSISEVREKIQKSGKLTPEESE
ncbi:unnamed protein product, partial [marine sediment metagenome]